MRDWIVQVCVVFVATVFCACSNINPQELQLLGTALYPWGSDSELKAQLEATGVAGSGKHVVAWFPADSLTAAQQADIIAMLDRGVGSAKRFVNKPQWSFRGDAKVYFYFPDANFVAHAPGGNSAFIPLWRIQEGKAPWLHEAVHLLVQEPGPQWLGQSDEFADANMPLWLYEGMAEYVAMVVSELEGLDFYSPMGDAPPNQLNEQCRNNLAEALSERVIESIGNNGKIPELFGPDRFAYAVPFYTCSSAFVFYIADHYGKHTLLAAVANFNREAEVLQAKIGKQLTAVKADWLHEIAEPTVIN